MISHWQTQLSESREIGTLTNVVEALQCAVTTLSEGETAGLKWHVDGSANFNALIRLCIKEIKGFCVRFLCGNNNVAASANKFDKNPFEVRDRSKQKWARLRPKIKAYMELMVKVRCILYSLYNFFQKTLWQTINFYVICDNLILHSYSNAWETRKQSLLY